jgi:hypothetical protein
MNLQQAQLVRKKLLYMEGLIAWNTREYIWKVIIGPKDRRHLDYFRELVDPSIPIDPIAILQPFRQEELSVYFFLKARGIIICREYQEFLSVNVQATENDYALTLLMPA